ncbi:hypothetical protein [Sporomusa sp. KB1]|jgi:hypothetical protein|uniref:hypothetical protein n=1 Tax=Sporomusa sp. KB1 TaxID=943346 RepID=UPI0011A4013B|nr:hypothetical protein [Sporomusa sp. KB1]TWH48560.1 hypothetical protein Salpa_4725 [Sporomusa sp. KB1]
MADRGGIPQFEWGAIGRISPSLTGEPRPFFSVRLKHLGHLALKVPSTYYGDALTWDQLASLGMPWGDNTTLLYEAPLPGWSYRFDIGLKRFTVTDTEGQATVYNNIKTISDLGISWDIISSHQFVLFFDAHFENDAFLIGWYLKKGYPIPPEWDIIPEILCDIYGYCWSDVEDYLQPGDYAVHFGRLLERQQETVDIEVPTSLSECERRNLLVNTTVDLSRATGGFQPNLKLSPEEKHMAKKSKDRAAELIPVGILLMIALFASISNASKPAFEPWMLWELWRWLGCGTVVVPRDRTFDLSPWWG